MKGFIQNKKILAYIIGLALGDGNLSNPNGRATRLRITCDIKYPLLIQKIKASIESVFPNNKVSIVNRKQNCIDVSCYSNNWETILGWKVGQGSKLLQNVSIPKWIKRNPEYKVECLRGLLETDGSVYNDRGYKMVMFVSAIPNLAHDAFEIMNSLGFKPNFHLIKRTVKLSDRYRQKPIYHVRVSKHVPEFLKLISLEKQ